MTGRITSLSITDSGFGYTTAPSVTISVPDQDSANATATASINGAGNLSAITLTDSGTYYISPPTVTISSPPGGVVTSASVVATGVAHVNGQNYNTTGGSGTGFIIRATSSGGLTSFTIIDGGKNYVAGDQVLTDNSPYEATIRIDSVGANTLATATAVVDSSTGGRISAINLVVVGTGYDSVPTVTIDSANGTAHDYRATATATLGDSGKIASLSITDSGAGYITAPTVTLEAAPRIVKILLVKHCQLVSKFRGKSSSTLIQMVRFTSVVLLLMMVIIMNSSRTDKSLWRISMTVVRFLGMLLRRVMMRFSLPRPNRTWTSTRCLVTS